MKVGHTCITYFAKSKMDLKEMQVIHFDQDMQVCGIFRKVLILNIFGTPLIHESLFLDECLLFECMGYLFTQKMGNFL